MPSERSVKFIRESLGEGESVEDFGKLLDILTLLRRPYESGMEEEGQNWAAERRAGRLLCLVVVPKPERYRRAMFQFRGLFAGIAEEQVLQGVFANSIRMAALVATEDQELTRPSTYFSLSPILWYRLQERGDEAFFRFRAFESYEYGLWLDEWF